MEKKGSRSRPMDKYFFVEDRETNWITYYDYAQPYHEKLGFRGNEPVDPLTGAHIKSCARDLGLTYWLTNDFHPLIFSDRGKKSLGLVTTQSVAPFLQSVSDAMGIIEHKIYPPHIIDAIRNRVTIGGANPHCALISHICDICGDPQGTSSGPVTYSLPDGTACMVSGDIITTGVASLVAHMNLNVSRPPEHPDEQSWRSEFVVKVPSPTTLLGHKSSAAPRTLQPYSALLLRVQAILREEGYKQYVRNGGIRLAEPLIATPHISIEEYIQKDEGPIRQDEKLLSKLGRFSHILISFVRKVESEHSSQDVRQLMSDFAYKIDLYDNRIASKAGMGRTPDRFDNIVVGTSTLNKEKGVFCVDPFAWNPLPPLETSRPVTSYGSPPWRTRTKGEFEADDFVKAFS